MKADDLLKIIQSPYNISTTTVTALNQLLTRYPYFQLVYTLMAKGMYEQDPEKAKHAIQLAAIYAPDRNRLKLLLENKLGYTNLVPNVAKATSKLKYTTHKQATDVLRKHEEKSGNVLPKASKKITPQKAFGQVHCIDKFIKHPPGKFKLQSDEDPLLAATGKDLTANNGEWKYTYLTETLARIMLQQDKFEKAIHIYQKLKDKFPEKNTYFDDIITQITKSYNTDSQKQ